MLLNRKLWGRFFGFSFIYNVCFAKFVAYNFQRSEIQKSAGRNVQEISFFYF